MFGPVLDLDFRARQTHAQVAGLLFEFAQLFARALLQRRFLRHVAVVFLPQRFELLGGGVGGVGSGARGNQRHWRGTVHAWPAIACPDELILEHRLCDDLLRPLELMLQREHTRLESLARRPHIFQLRTHALEPVSTARVEILFDAVELLGECARHGQRALVLLVQLLHRAKADKLPRYDVGALSLRRTDQARRRHRLFFAQKFQHLRDRVAELRGHLLFLPREHQRPPRETLCALLLQVCLLERIGQLLTEVLVGADSTLEAEALLLQNRLLALQIPVDVGQSLLELDVFATERLHLVVRLHLADLSFRLTLPRGRSLGRPRVTGRARLCAARRPGPGEALLELRHPSCRALSLRLGRLEPLGQLQDLGFELSGGLGARAASLDGFLLRQHLLALFFQIFLQELGQFGLRRELSLHGAQSADFFSLDLTHQC